MPGAKVSTWGLSGTGAAKEDGEARWIQTNDKEEAKMTTLAGKPLTVRFIEAEESVHLELSNESDDALKCVEILTVFLKDLETPGGGPSQAHIRFDQIDSLRAKENVVLSHKTWINGKVAAEAVDLMERLKVVAGQVKPYVLDISWQDSEGKARFQRIPVGH